MKRYLLLVSMIMLACFSLAAQTGPGQERLEQGQVEQDEMIEQGQTPQDELAGDTEKEEEIIETPENRILEMDIKTSSLMELAAWSRSLGLSEGGTRDDLANRLRNYYNLPRLRGTDTSSQKVIVIESARTTEYFTLEVVDEEYARLRGDVVITLKDGDVSHRISAWEILYNRTRNVVTASGGVVYIREEGTSIETFKGELITVNLDNWSSIFLDGVSERSTTESDTAYRFSGTVISTNNEEATILSNATISNGKNPDALWSLNAKKLWLLPGSDWAVLNAVLKVGNVPVLWLPFFYYPADEVIFHPVLGTRSREGVFVQTTTFVLGRP
jgi:lipopolysaccharide assembly outer membrane protein LptD (OstA)